MTVVIVCAVLVLGAFLAGLTLGERMGVRETERRWSDAVGRADDARRAQR